MKPAASARKADVSSGRGSAVILTGWVAPQAVVWSGMRVPKRAVFICVVGVAVAGACSSGPNGGGGSSSSSTRPGDGSSSSSSTPGGACVPGAQVACACPGGGQGAQVCNGGGTGLSACTGCGGGGGSPASSSNSSSSSSSYSSTSSGVASELISNALVTATMVCGNNIPPLLAAAAGACKAGDMVTSPASTVPNGQVSACAQIGTTSFATSCTYKCDSCAGGGCAAGWRCPSTGFASRGPVTVGTCLDICVTLDPIDGGTVTHIPN